VLLSKQYADEEELANQKWELADERIRSMVLSEVEIRKAGFETIQELKGFYRDLNDEAFNEEFAKLAERSALEVELALDKEKQIADAKIKAEGAVTKAIEEKAKAKTKEIESEKKALWDNLGEVAKHSKKVAKLMKARAIVSATIKTYESATGAYNALVGIPVIGPALAVAGAAAAIGAGMANVSAIRSQPIQGFEGGGYIPDAPRIGGVDGRGGKFAVLHPDESIYDHKKGQGMGGGITINLSNNFEGDASEQKMSDFISNNYDAVYNAVAMAKADMGEDF